MHVYFQGLNSGLYRINSDGSNFFQIGTNTTDAAPFVFSDPADGEWVYFRGHNDSKLWKVRGDNAGTDLTQIGTNTTNSTPFVWLDPSTNEVWIFFQGTDNKLWKVRNDAAGSGLLNIGGNYTRVVALRFRGRVGLFPGHVYLHQQRAPWCPAPSGLSSTTGLSNRSSAVIIRVQRRRLEPPNSSAAN